MADVHHCLECGREFTHTPLTGNPIHFYGEEGYCSEGCLRKHQAIAKRENLAAAKKHAEKALKKLNKQKDILQEKIDNISAAVRKEDPGAIEKAIKGSLFKRAGGCLVMCLKLIGLLIIIGIAFANGVSYEYRKSRTNNTTGESTEVGVDNSTAIDMQKQKREEQLLERRRALLQTAGEDGKTTAPVTE